MFEELQIRKTVFTKHNQRHKRSKVQTCHASDFLALKQTISQVKRRKKISSPAEGFKCRTKDD